MPARVLVVGGGYVGLYAALRLQRSRAVTVTLVSPDAVMTYQPFLPEAAAGSIEPRHVVVSLRRVLRRCTVLTGTVTAIRHADRVVTVTPIEGPAYDVGYDELVVAPGSVARVLPIPGLADQGIGFKTVAEAIYLRNHVLSRLDAAASTADSAVRERLLTFVSVGGGYAGVEALAELEDLARYAQRYYPQLAGARQRWVLVEAADRILGEISEGMASYTLVQLRRRGIEVRLGTRLESAIGGRMVLSDGESFDADTLIWTAGVRAHPVLDASDLPRDVKGRVFAETDLRVRGVEHAWTAGDCAAVPDLTMGGLCGPTAQHAVRQAKRLARNLLAAVAGKPLTPYRHKNVGSVASLGLHKGVAEVYGIRLRGFLAWFMHRTYHVSRVPTFNRKVRVVADWTLALFFRREVVSLGSLHDPRAEFRRAAS